MIRVRQIEVDINMDNEDNLLKACSKKIGVNFDEIKLVKIVKKSLDARKKPKLFYSYEIDILVNNEKQILKKYKNNNNILVAPNEKYKFEVSGNKKLDHRPIIVGSGPSGLFCAYFLAKNGYRPMIIERGDKVEDRCKSVQDFWDNNKLDINSNVQFGEGGAGTFSDGKLNTLVKDKYNRGKKVLEIFKEAGAPEEITYLNKPHIGTDILQNVVKNMRNKIIDMGGEYRFNTCLTDIIIKDNKVTQIEVNNSELIDTDIVILGIGHSARDTFYMLNNKKIEMEAKPFAMGVRIQHPQKMINESQYGIENIDLDATSYKLTYNTQDKRGVYTFCMCPGGYVVNSSSEEKRLSINGMSDYKRDSLNANSAVIVTVNKNDFGNNPLSGLEFQRELEEKAYQEGNGNIPIQLFKDFKDNIASTNLGDVTPVFKGNYCLSNLNNILPKFMSDSLIEGINYFGRKISGFNRDDAILAAIESRTSSPVRIIRDENFESNTGGIYPMGEGAGYAGGITSAAIDGIKTAEAIAKVYSSLN